MGGRARSPVPALSCRRLATAAVAAVAALAAAAAPARAQQAQSESVLGRPRPAFTPIGLELDEVLSRIGLVDRETVKNKSSPLASFVVHPTTEFAQSYDSNIFRTEKDKQGDGIFDFRPSLAINSDWVNHEAHLTAGADIGRYYVHPEEDFVDYNAGGGGRIDVTEALQLTGDASFTHGRIARGTPDNPGGPGFPPEITEVLNARGEARYQADAVLLRAGIARDDIANSGGDPVTTPDADRVETTATVRAGYEFSPGTVAFFEPSYNVRNYTRRVDSFGLLQGSSGYRVQAGLTWDVTGVTFAEFGVGYLRQTYDEPSFDPVSGISASARLIWNPTGLITVTGGLDRRVDETTLVGVSGILVTAATLGVDYEYLDDLIVSARFGYSDESFQAIRRDDRVVTGSLSFDYRIGSKWYARLGYDMTRRQSTVAGAGFSDQILSLTLGEHL